MCHDRNNGVEYEHERREKRRHAVYLAVIRRLPRLCGEIGSGQERLNERVSAAAYEPVNEQRILLREKQLVQQQHDGGRRRDNEQYQPYTYPAMGKRPVHAVVLDKAALPRPVLPADGEHEHVEDQCAADHGDYTERDIRPEHGERHGHEQAQNIPEDNISYPPEQKHIKRLSFHV